MVSCGSDCTSIVLLPFLPCSIRGYREGNPGTLRNPHIMLAPMDLLPRHYCT